MRIRLLNFGFYFLLTLIFVLAAGPFDKPLILFAFVLSLLIAYISFMFHWLSLDGMKTAVIIGTVTLGLGGWEFTVYLLVFFISSNLIAAGLNLSGKGSHLNPAERRSAYQVWANGFWFILLISFWFVFDAFLSIKIAAAGALATATADTWATLIGGCTRKKIRLITNFKLVEPGADGGISLIGTFAGFLGAAIIALIFMLFAGSLAFWGGLSILIGGFSGCLADSYFGAIFQHEGKSLRLFGYEFSIGNDMVNWLATATGALISFVLFNIFYYALV